MKMNLLKHVVFTTLPTLVACMPQAQEHVVTDKGNGKLIVRNLSGSQSESVLVCGKSDRAKLFYQTVNVGDTLTCNFSQVERGVCVYEDIPAWTINGDAAIRVMTMAERDSVIARARREIQQTR